MLTLDELKVAAVAARNFPPGYLFPSTRVANWDDSRTPCPAIAIQRYSPEEPYRFSEMVRLYRAICGDSTNDTFVLLKQMEEFQKDLNDNPKFVASIFQVVIDIAEGNYQKEVYLQHLKPKKLELVEV